MSSLRNPFYTIRVFEDFVGERGHPALHNSNWWMVSSAWSSGYFPTAYLARRAAMIWVRGGHQATVWPPNDAKPLTIQPGTERSRRLLRMERTEGRKRTERMFRRRDV